MKRTPSLFAFGLFGALAACAPDNGTQSSPGGGSGGLGESQNPAGGGQTSGQVNGQTNPGNWGGSGTVEPGGENQQGGGGNTDCQVQHIDAFADAADMMIVLDRSSSMIGINATDLIFGRNRWEPTVRALEALTNDFGELIAFGLTVFPGPSQPNPFGNGCVEGQVLVPPAADNASQINSQIQANAPGNLDNLGLTPTSTGLNAALNTLGNRTASPDNVPRPAFVLLVTDGQPSCDPLGLTYQQDVDAALAAVTALHGAGIPTYVLGFDIASAPAANGFLPVDTMNQLAQAGGTERYYEVGDGTFEATVRDIAATAVTCTFELATQPQDLNYVLVTIDGNQININDPNLNGWVIDGKTVTLQEGACNRLKDGKRHDVKVEIVCDEVTPI